MFRLILISLFVFLYFIPFGLPVLLLCYLVGVFSPDARAMLALTFLKGAMRVICDLAGVTVNAIGTENIPDTPVYFVSNHRGFFDIFTTYRYVDRICGTVSKIEWKKIPLLNTWMSLIHCVFLDRSSPRKGLESTRLVVKELENGHSFWIYPEGTRAHGDEFLPFKEGAFRAAFMTGTPVLPVTIIGTDDAFEKHLPHVTPAEVTLVFGKPHPTEGIDRSDYKSFIHAIREEMQGEYDHYKRKE